MVQPGGLSLSRTVRRVDRLVFPQGRPDTLNGKADAATVDSIKKQQEKDAGRIGDLETATGELQPKVIDLGEYTPGKGFYLDEDLEEIAAVMLAATKGKAPLLLKS